MGSGSVGNNGLLNYKGKFFCIPYRIFSLRPLTVSLSVSERHTKASDRLSKTSDRHSKSSDRLSEAFDRLSEASDGLSEVLDRL